MPELNEERVREIAREEIEIFLRSRVRLMKMKFYSKSDTEEITRPNRNPESLHQTHQEV